MKKNKTQSATSPHGTVKSYAKGCRCDDCRRANTERHKALKGKEPPSHGRSGYSNYGCRCDICRAAHSEAMRSEERKEYIRQWNRGMTEEQREKRSATHREYRRRTYVPSPSRILTAEEATELMKRYSRALLNRAVRAGIVEREPCACGRIDSQGHHADYMKPLDAEWLCSSCHADRHRLAATG
jgi:hypothetical protein